MEKMRNTPRISTRFLYFLPFALLAFMSIPFSNADAARPTSVTNFDAGEYVADFGTGEQDQKEPSFPGGMPALMNYLSKNIVYPAQAVSEKIEGRVLLQFVVSKKGRIKDVKVLQSPHPLLDAEAVRVVEGMPRWVPGEVNGKPANIRMNLPVTFKLSK